MNVLHCVTLVLALLILSTSAYPKRKFSLKRRRDRRDAKCDRDDMKETIATFNAGLTPLVDDYLNRRTELYSQIPDAAVSGINFMCLQEFW